MTATALTVSCRKCQNPLPVGVEGCGQVLGCPTCGDPFRIDLFPRLIQSEPASQPKPLIENDQASCFYHEPYQAEVTCQGCGRFLCGLCDIQFLGDHHCVVCIESMQQEELPILIRSEIRWGFIALGLLLLSMPLWIIGFMTIPLSFFIYFKFGRQKNRVFPPRISELLMVLLLGLAVTVGVGAIYVMLISTIFFGG